MQQPALAGPDAPVHEGGEGLALGAEGLHAVQGAVGGVGVGRVGDLAGDVGGGVGGGVCAGPGLGAQGVVEFDEAGQGRAQQGEVFVFVDKPGEGDPHAHEGLGDLHEGADGEGAAEHARALQQVGDEGADFGVGVVGQGDALGVGHDGGPVLAHGGEAGGQAGLFGAAAAEQGDLAGAFAYAQQGGAEVGFGALLFVVDAHHAAADFFHEPGADEGVGQGDPEHVAGHAPVAPPEVQGQRAGDVPDDGREGKERDGVAEQAQAQAQGVGRQQAQVFGHALVNVFDVGGVVALFQLPEGVAGQPAAHEVLREPVAPADFDGLGKPGARGVERQPAQGQQGECAQQGPEGGGVHAGEGVVEVLLPVGDERGAPDQDEVQRDDQRQQGAAGAAFGAAPPGGQQRPGPARAGRGRPRGPGRGRWRVRHQNCARRVSSQLRGAP